MFKTSHILIPLIALALLGCKKEALTDIPRDRLTVEYSVDRETIRIGDPVTMVVAAYYPTNGMLELPEIGREKEIVLLKRDWETVPGPDGLVRSETRYSITSFVLGDQMVSTNAIVCRIGDGLMSTNFPSIVLQVESSLSDDGSSKIADIKPVHKLPGRISRWILIVLGAAAVAFLVGLITSRLWKQTEKSAPMVPAIPPYLIALKALQTLKEKGLLERDECEPFYTELSLILRRYLEGRFKLNAPDETTEEIVEEMSRSPELTGAQRNILQEFMRQADLVKFAKGHPNRTTMENAFDSTKHFVEETRHQTDVAAKERIESKGDAE